RRRAQLVGRDAAGAQAVERHLRERRTGGRRDEFRPPLAERIVEQRIRRAHRAATPESTPRKPWENSARSPQPRLDTMLRSTTQGASSNVPPACSMSGASGGKAVERRPCNNPSAAVTCGP